MRDNNTRKRAKLTRSKFAAYSAAGAAAMACTSANAAITYTTVNQTLSDTNADPTLIDNAAVLQLTINNSFQLGMWHNRLGATLGSAAAGGQLLGNVPAGVSVAGMLLQNPAPPMGMYNYVSNLAYGAQLSLQAFLAPNALAPLMAYANGYTNSAFKAQGEGFLGFRFNTNQYGWVRVQMNGTPLNDYTVVDFAFAGPGETLRAGQTTAVPEPGSLATLALGAVGLAAWRRKRQVA